MQAALISQEASPIVYGGGHHFLSVRGQHTTTGRKKRARKNPGEAGGIAGSMEPWRWITDLKLEISKNGDEAADALRYLVATKARGW